MTQIDTTTQSVLLSEVRQGLAGLQHSVQKLERTVDGDTSMGVPSLRQAVRGVADELKNEAADLCDRIDRLETAREAQDNYMKGMMAVGKFLGLTSLTGVLGLIGMLTGVIGK